MNFYLTKAAKADLKLIAKYTEKEHGIVKRNEYLSHIDSLFHLLSQNPNIGIDCSQIKIGYRKYPVKKHNIYYVLLNNSDVEIVRILHSRMDIISKV